MRLKQVLKDWLPPVVVRAACRARKDQIRFEGNYSSWEAAAAQCTGYDSDHILAKVLDATLKVKRGEAAYERDSVVFDEIQYAWPVTAALMWAAAQNGGRLDVLDFGGALGSSYFQNRPFLAHLPEVRWAVVEQPHYVAAGRKHIQDETLRFYNSIDECLIEGRPNAILLSSVLQYLPKPKLTLKIILEIGAEILIVDRTPFWKNEKPASIAIQHVPPLIYRGSYPCWFFNFSEILELMLSLGYRTIVKFDSLDKLSHFAVWRGLVAKKAS